MSARPKISFQRLLCTDTPLPERYIPKLTFGECMFGHATTKNHIPKLVFQRLLCTDTPPKWRILKLTLGERYV